MKKKVHLLTFVFILSLYGISFGQTNPRLKVYPATDPEVMDTLITNVLFGGGGKITGVQYLGNIDGIGHFDQGNDIGFPEGLILSNGYVKNAEGFNVTGAFNHERDVLGEYMDDDLNSMLGLMVGSNQPDTALDCSKILLFFKPHFSSIKLNYVFASEEYYYHPEGKPDVSTIDSAKVDPMGIYYWNNPTAKTLLSTVPVDDPNADEYPVLVKYINQNESSQYYKENVPGFPSNQMLSTENDGLTVPMFIDQEVEPCLTYGIKIAIADFTYYDTLQGIPMTQNFNSSVFLEAGSLVSGNGLEWDINMTNDNSDFEPDEMVEGGCSNMIVTVSKSIITTDTVWVRFKIDGATMDDYIMSPAPKYDSLLGIPGDQLEATYILEAVLDGIPEGDANGIEDWRFRWNLDPCDVPGAGGIGSQNQGYSGEVEIDVYDYNTIQTATKTFGPTPNSIYFCGNEVTLNVSDVVEGGIPPYTYTWNHIPTGDIGLDTDFDIIISDNPDSSRAIVKDRCTPLDNYPTGTVYALVFSELTHQASPDFQLCENLVWPITITETNVGNDFSVVWKFQGNTVGTNKVYDVDWAEYGQYYGVLDSLVFEYIVTDECGNTNSGEVVAFWDPIVAIAGLEVICLGSDITLTCTDGQSYQWYWNSVSTGNEIPGANNKTVTLTPADSGYHTVCVEILNACDQPASTCYEFYVSQMVCELELNNTTIFDICPNTPFELEELNGFTDWNWSWFDGGQTHNETGRTINLRLLDPGQTSITVSAFNEFGCYDEREFIINVFPYTELTSLTEFDSICIGNTSTLSTSSIIDLTNHLWSSSPFDNTLTGQETSVNPVVAPTQTTIYTCYTFDQNGCRDSSDIEVILRVPIQAGLVAAPDEVCTYDETVFSFGGYNTPPGASYNWTFELGDPPNSNLATQEVMWDTAGIWNIHLAYAEPGCDQEFNSTFSVNPKPLPMISSNVIEGCEPLEVQFANLSMDLENPQFTWYFGDDSTSNEENPLHIYQEEGIYDVSLHIINSTGCENEIDFPGFVEVFQKPDAEMTAEPIAATIDNPEISFFELVDGGYDYILWDFGDGSTSTEDNPSHIYTSPGIWDVIMEVENDKGCVDTAFMQVSISETINLYFPTAFSPNGDGSNDCFTIVGTVYDVINNFRVRIFNRWGQLVYESKINDPSCLWDGNDQNGQPAKADSYIYYVFGADFKGVRHEFRGMVTVVR